MTSPYRRLPGRGRRKGSFLSLTSPISSAWVGPDHVLAVDLYGAAEDYRRFYFREIQAFGVKRTRRYEIWAAVLVPLLVAFLWATLAATDESRWFLGAMALFFGLCLAIHLLRGPTCRCYVLTRVGREELGAFSRLRTARKALDALRPLVVAQQREVALAIRRAREAAAAAAAVPAAAAS
jgi:hypothetical protein